MKTNEAQLKISKQVENYKALMPHDYDEVVRIVREKREVQNNDVSKIGKGDGLMERALVEYPEVLWNFIYKALEPDELVWFNTKEGLRWFAKTYPEFRLAKRI